MYSSVLVQPLRLILAVAFAVTAACAQDIRLTRIVSGLSEPVYVTHAGDGSRRLFIVERRGLVKIFDGTTLLSKPFLNVKKLISTNSNERGLLSIAFHPDFETNGFFYSAFTNKVGDGIFARFSVSPTNPNLANKATEKVLLVNEHSTRFNHYGGAMQFGPDGELYVSVGDGGYTFPEPADPEHHGQNLKTIQGKILRLDVNVTHGKFHVASDNPFVNIPGAKKTIWAYGFRNPWRFSFDRETGRLFVADVGHYLHEEINIVERGGNYGWSVKEGKACFNSESCNDDGMIDPIHEYTHSPATGGAVIGGYVYRGTAIPGLNGKYIFGDFESGRIWALTEEDGHWHSAQLLHTDLLISSFGEGEDGELYVVSYTGEVYRIDPA